MALYRGQVVSKRLGKAKSKSQHTLASGESATFLAGNALDKTSVSTAGFALWLMRVGRLLKVYHCDAWV